MDYSKLKKLELNQYPLNNIKPDQIVEAIIKVKENNYIPEDITVRSRISEFLFTAQFQGKFLEDLENNPLIDTISISKKLPLINPIKP